MAPAGGLDLVWMFSNLVGVAACYYLLAIYIPKRDEAMREAWGAQGELLEHLFAAERETSGRLVDQLAGELRSTARSVDVLSGLVYQLLQQRPGRRLSREEIERAIEEFKSGGATAAQMGFGPQ